LVRALADVLRIAPGANTAEVTIDIAPDERPPIEPRFFHHNFPAGDSRPEVLKSLLPNAKVNLRQKSDMPHFRALTAELADGRRVEILLDQGLGAWRVSRSVRLDFRLQAAALARTLSNSDYDLEAEALSVPVAITVT
jgi:hypothetical protein